jgi:hypothetical protein
MSNLLAIESAFLQNATVRQAINLSAIETLNTGIRNAKKQKFDKSVELSELVLKAMLWFTSEEGVNTLTSEGIAWTSEDIFNKVFGWQKSFAYKMLKVGKLQEVKPEVITKFKRDCTIAENNGDDVNRTVEGLLQYAKALEQQAAQGDESEGEEGEEGEATPSVTREKAIFVLTWKNDVKNVSVRVTESGELKTTNNAEEIKAAIEFLQGFL